MPSVLTNLSALSAQMAQKSSSRSISTVMQQLSTSKRINSAVDDVAGLAISTRLTSQIRGLNQSIRNMNDQISLLQTAEGGLEGITNALQRMRELRIQSLNGTSNPADKAFIEEEITNLRGDIDRILSTTEFNGIKMLNGNAAASKWSASQSGSQPFIAAASATSNIISVFTPDGNEGMKEQQIRTNYSSTSVKIADMNGDGYDDIVTETGVFINDGINNFTEKAAFGPPPYGTSDVSVGDVNNDGKTDILITNNGEAGLLFINKGSDVYQYSYYQGSNTLDAILADMNNDGNLDFLAGVNGNLILNESGHGDGTFLFAGLPQTPNVGARTLAFKATDLNNDGLLDVVSVNTRFPYFGGDPLTYALQNPDGSFSPPVAISNASFAHRIEVGDLNGDGKIDLVTTNVDSSISIYINQSNGSFVQTQIQLPQNRGDTSQDNGIRITPKTGIAIKDMNGDGSPDLVIGNGQTNAINIYKNAGNGSFTLLDTLTSDHSLDGVAVSGSFTYQDGSDDPVLKQLDNMKLSSLNVANPSLDNIDAFLQAVNASRSEVGAYVSRLNYRIDNYANESSRAQESRSRILDTEYSSSTTELAKQQIIQQASTAMLAQANQEPQTVLQLIKSTSS